ncbi:hypothetical protein ITJ86_01095 [Winogradskyella sp. F6397]|uniref:Antitoxin component YwqK of the YwqJK toxin-antitoxin module n=1 Tax=Winogradskyella marina TaxID=2785530 RepID=A0ABS0EE59_9FLAO|nr:hypothetical protein [Winogradskyella marina]MBF8148471.1 hypothetical protein [Winogradskyella marina]
MILLNSTKTILLLFIVSTVFMPLTLEAQQDTIYYDMSWNGTTKDNAAFYRPPVKKEGDFYRIEDYYISGQKQMSGLSKYEDKDYWVEKVSWYNEDGQLYQQGNYTKNRLDGAFITFLDGKKLTAIYKKGFIKSGAQNTIQSSNRIYTEVKNDTVKEVVYDSDINGIRYESFRTLKKGHFRTKYYGKKGDSIGEIITLKNGFRKGVEVFYYFSPMRVKQINYYPFTGLLGHEDYYPNGQVRTKFQTEPEYKNTYFTEDGTEIGSVTYKLQNDYLKPIKGTRIVFSYSYKEDVMGRILSSKTYNYGLLEKEELYYDSGKIKSLTTYTDNIKELQVSYDETGNELSRMVYKNYYPYTGVEISGNKRSTYKEGELIEELKYYSDTNVLFSKKNKEEEVYYSKDGDVLGILKVQYKNRYAKPLNGTRYEIGYDSEISNIETYKDGNVIERTKFITKLVGKDNLVDFKVTEYYNANQYSKSREVNYYSNGSKQSDITYTDYDKTLGKFYNDKNELIGTYDYDKKHGKLYEFFDLSDEIKLIKGEENGDLIALKRFDYGVARGYGVIDPVLIEDVDVNCCATFYDTYGEVLAEINFKNKLPWEGEMYDKTTRVKYTIKDGKRNGTYKKFNYNYEVVLEEGHYVNDKKEGTFNSYNQSGVLQLTSTFKNDVLEGKSINYNEDGKEVSSIIYKDGKPFEGTKVLTVGYNSKSTQEIYKNGLITKRISYDLHGKNVSTFKNGEVVETVAYHIDSNHKRLQYSLNKNYIDGEVIRYDKNGKEQHRGVVKNHKLESGVIYLSAHGLYDNRMAYIILKRNADIVQLTLVGENKETLFYAEEKVEEGYGMKYIDKLNIHLDYLHPESLY